REQFLTRNITGYPAAAWINANLPSTAKVFTAERQLIYHFDVPAYYGHPTDDARIDIHPGARDRGRFYAQLRNQGVTHILIRQAETLDAESGIGQWRSLASHGCLRPAHTVTVDVFQSRTLPSLSQTTTTLTVLEFDETACQAMNARSAG
ncbi:MAG: hypothetical protein K0Q70_1694, partial [Rhodospirillales bacterium]|nr:hypothetical protein [Rhodospirillales bacterium]